MSRRIILAGGSGFLGRRIALHLQPRGWEPIVLTRRPSREAVFKEIAWDARKLGDWAQSLEGAEAVINLAGRSVNCRYNAENRRAIVDSRVDSTRVLGEAVGACRNPPRTWLNSSTATIYRHTFGPPQGESSTDWNFTARVNRIASQGSIALPFSAQINDTVTGTFTFDYADAGTPGNAPFIRRYPDQPSDLITAFLEGVILVDAPLSVRHEVEIWNDSEWNDGQDLFFLSYQTLLDPRYPGLEANMTLSGGDLTGLTISNLNLPTVLRAGDFGGLTFSLFIIDPRDLMPSYTLEGRVIDIWPVGAISDADGDGVPDDQDRCADTPAGAVVNENGCSIEQLVPCTARWRNHGQYVTAVIKVAGSFQRAGLITGRERNEIVRAAARSNCGKKSEKRRQASWIPTIRNTSSR